MIITSCTCVAAGGIISFSHCMQGPQGVRLTHRVSDLDGDLGADELMHHPVMGSRKAGFMKQTCTLSDIYVNIYVTFM